MLILYQMNSWHCRHLDYILSFAQALTDTGAYLKIPTGFDIENNDRKDVSDEYYLKLLKNYYETKDTAANQFNVLQKAFKQYSFQHNTDIDLCLFTRNNCIIIIHAGDYLIFYENQKIFNELIESLKDDFKLTDEGDLETFLDT